MDKFDSVTEAGVVTRHPGNPLLTAADVPYPCNLLFNAGVARWKDTYYMVFRNDYELSEERVREFDGRIPPHKTNLGFATSGDGVAWSVAENPVMTLDTAKDVGGSFYANRDREEIRRFYDPRLTVIDGRIYMCFAVDTRHGIRGGIAVTDDFESFEVLTMTVPDNRNMVLFPEKIGGYYYRLERPFPVYGRAEPEAFDVWISRSPDMMYWGASDLVIGVEDVPFADRKIGPGAPPIRTDEGWLTTFHGVDWDDTRGKNGWESSWKKFYYIGIMLLDLDNPARVIGISKVPLMKPTEPYETEGGFRNKVLFPGGMISEADGTVKIYYGAADTYECLATATIDDLVALCRS